MDPAVGEYYGEALPQQLGFETLAPPQPAVASRSKWSPLAFLLPLVLCGTSWMAGGVPALTDAGFIGLTIICVTFCIIELLKFPRRTGVGALMLYGGIVVWFGLDYLSYWVGLDFSLSPFPPATVAKAAALHCLFVLMMSVGLQLPYGKWIERQILKLPEVPREGYYFFLVILFFVLGVLPYFLFTEDPWVEVFRKSFTQMRGGVDPIRWTVGRSGNVNYNWGGYVAQWVDAGYLGGLSAAFYAVLIARHWPSKIVAWAIWGFWTLLAYGGGTRGQVVFMGIPVIALLFIKHQMLAAALSRRFSFKAYVFSGLLLLLVFGVVQFQGAMRTLRDDQRMTEDVEYFKVAGNHMFSEGMLGYYLIPETRPFFYDRFPGEAIVRPIPDFLFHGITHPIPRALWHGKPIDPLFVWYNATVTGKGEGREGTTISRGLVGSWYFKYGLAGVIEGGLLMGLLFGIAERVLQKSEGRPLVIMMSLGLLTWLFRCFRDVAFPELWALLLGFGVLALLVKFGQVLFPQARSDAIAG